MKLKVNFLTSELLCLPFFPISGLFLYQENFLNEVSAGAVEQFCRVFAEDFCAHLYLRGGREGKMGKKCKSDDASL